MVLIIPNKNNKINRIKKTSTAYKFSAVLFYECTYVLRLKYKMFDKTKEAEAWSLSVGAPPVASQSVLAGSLLHRPSLAWWLFFVEGSSSRLLPLFYPPAPRPACAGWSDTGLGWTSRRPAGSAWPDGPPESERWRCRSVRRASARHGRRASPRAARSARHSRRCAELGKS